MNRWWALGLCLVAAAGLLLRGVRLDNRPMHNDEAVNAIKLGGYWGGISYRYDPNEHHGPTLYYCSLPVVWLTGTRHFDELSEVRLRLTPALFGVGLIVLLWLLRDGLGDGAMLMAAFLTACSPAMVFYSRYYIHEMLLAFFTLLVLGGAWRYAQCRRWEWAALTGAGVGLMFATKETFVFSLVAMFGALVLTAALERGWGGIRRFAGCLPASHVGMGIVAASLISLALFTSFFTNADGPLDSIRTYLPWLKRAGGDSPHVHPWFFYLERLVFFQRPRGIIWSEGLIVGLGIVGLVAGLTGRALGRTNRSLARIIAFYTLGLLATYSAISYKTPWCLVGFLHGFILLAGVGAMVVFYCGRQLATRAALTGILSLAAIHLVWQTLQASFVRQSDWRSPYVYAQTLPDILRLADQIRGLAQVHPDANQMILKIASPDSDYWPLPYYLREFQKVGWYETLPDDPYAPVVVSSSRLGALLDEKSDKRWLMGGLYQLRPGVFLELYVEKELWSAWIAQRR